MINIAIQNLEKSNKNSYEFINEKQELFVSSYNKKTQDKFLIKKLIWYLGKLFYGVTVLIFVSLNSFGRG